MGGTCYDPSGQSSTQYTACGVAGKDGFALCCRQGWLCLPDNLCGYTGTDQNTISKGVLERGLCTDKSFNSPSCPQFCLSGDYATGGNIIKNCENGTGCCKTNGDCSCGVGSPGALLLGYNTILSYTAIPTAPYTALISGIQVSVVTPTPTPQATSSPKVQISQTPSSSPTAASSPLVSPVSASSSIADRSSSQADTTNTSSVTSASLSSSPSSTSGASPSLSLGATTGSAPASAATTSSSAIVGGSSSSGVSGLGVKIGVPIGLVVVLGALIAAFFFFRKHSQNESRRQSKSLFSGSGSVPQWRPIPLSSPGVSPPRAQGHYRDIKKPYPPEYPQPTYHEWSKRLSYDTKESVAMAPIYPPEKTYKLPEGYHELAGPSSPTSMRHELG